MSQQHVSLQKAAGPVANAYGQSRARVCAIVGPTGGGKTTESVKRCVRVAQWQHASPRDGIRRARITCVGPTYRQLWKTAIPSYRETMRKMGLLNPKKDPNWKGSEGDPASHVFDLSSPNHGQLHIEVLFEAVNDEKLEDFVRGRETTAWWLPEMDTLPEDLIQLASNRVGRYPSPDDRPPIGTHADPSYSGVFGDANVPDIGTWFHRRFWLSGQRPDHWKFYRQPAGVLPGGPPWITNPLAENLENLRKIDPDYYQKMIADMENWAIRRFVGCKPGYSRHGEPVHPLFDDEVHVPPAQIAVDPYAVVIFGVDGGGNTNLPGVTALQADYSHNWKALDCFAPHEGTSAPEVGAWIKHCLANRIRKARGAVIFIDPAAAVRSPLSPTTYAQQLQASSGVEVRLAPSQKPVDRRGALSRRGGPLDRRGGFAADPVHCVPLIEALAGGFRYAKKNKDKGLLTPEKNLHSHVAESCEYGVLGGEGLTDTDGLVGPEGAYSDADFLAPIL